MSLLDKVLRFGEGKKMKSFQAGVSEVSALEDSVRPLADETLRAKTIEFRERLAQGGSTYGGHATLRCAGVGRAGAPLRGHCRDEDRRRQDPSGHHAHLRERL